MSFIHAHLISVRHDMCGLNNLELDETRYREDMLASLHGVGWGYWWRGDLIMDGRGGGGGGQLLLIVVGPVRYIISE